MLVRWLIAIILLSLPFHPWPSLAQQKDVAASKIDLQGLKKILTENKDKVVLLNFFSPF